MRTVVKTEVIMNHLFAHRLTKGEFCKICKISPITLRSILLGNETYTITSIRPIAAGMNVPVATLFKKVD